MTKKDNIADAEEASSSDQAMVRVRPQFNSLYFLLLIIVGTNAQTAI